MTAEKMHHLYEDFKQISQDKDVNITFTDYLYYLYQEEKPSKIFSSSVDEIPTADRPYVKRLDKLFETRVKKL